MLKGFKSSPVRAASKASEAERWFQALLDAAPDAMVVVDQDGKIVLVNTQTEKLFEYEREEILGLDVEVLMPERLREQHRLDRKGFFAQPHARPMGAGLELFGLRKGGTEFPVEVSLSPVKTKDGVLVTSAIRDVSERKLVEESRLRLAAIVESSDDAVYSKTLDGVIVSWNAGAQQIYGYTQAEAVGKPINILVPPELREEQNKILERLRAGERIEHYETVRVTKAGRRINISLSLSPIKDSTGTMLGICGIARDITERRQAEEALRENEQRLRLATQAGRMYSFEWDVRTGVVVRSPEYVTVLGATEHSRSTHPLFVDKIHPDDRPKFTGTIAELTPDNPTGIVMFRVKTDDGALLWLRSSGRGIFDDQGRLQRVIGMVADVTDLKRAEEALRASEGRLRLAQQTARIGTFERDVRTGRITWAEGLESLYGLPLGGVDGQTLAFFKALIHPADRERVADIIETALKTGQPTEAEWRAVWPDGSVHWIAARWQVLMDDSGEPSRVVGVNMDITERKLAEQSLAEMTRTLIESQEQERSRIGRELHDDINQRLAMLGVELEQPLDPSEFQSRVRRFQDELRQISADVQALSHDLHSTKLEYLGVIAGMKSWCREFAERQKMEVDFKSEVRSALPLDVGRPLFRVLQEALHNSFKHSGVKRIEVKLREDSGEIHLIISDLGRGFDIEAAFQGKGLGLTSMRERVRLVKGTIEIQTRPMGGTTIHIRVPLASEDKEQRAAG